MTDYSSEIIAELFRRTAALAVAAVVIAGLLSMMKPTSARIHRLLWTLVLLQGWLVFQYQVPIPWFEAPQFAVTADENGKANSFPVEITKDEQLPTDIETPETEIIELKSAVPIVEEMASKDSAPSTMPLTATEPGNRSREMNTDSSTVEASSQINLPGILVGVWITGMLLVVFRWLFGYIRFVRSVPRSQTETPNGPLQVRWNDLLKKRGVDRSIKLRKTATLGPVLCRLPRGYTLFLPRQFWNGLSEVEQTLVLEHELAHYLRRDVWKSLFIRLLALPHWFNPCAWWAVCRFDQCAEWACDETARQLEPEQRISYAKTLMRLVEQAGSAQPCRSALFGSSVLYRVKRLLSPQPPEDTKMKKLVLSGLVLALLAFSLIRPQLVAQTPDSNVIAGNAQAVKSENGKTEVFRLPESLSAVKAEKQPAVPREKIRYDGKSFEEWKEILETELKPNRRAEALRAFGEFGIRGYRKEAAQAIMSVVREYEFTGSYRSAPSDIDSLQIAAVRAFRQIASEEVLDILRTELQSGEAGRQKFVFRVFTERPVRQPVEEKIRKLAPQLAPEFIAIARNQKSDQRVNAIEILRVRMYKTKEVIPTFQNLINDKDSDVAKYARRALAWPPLQRHHHAREEKKKAQDRELDGVGVPMEKLR